MRCTENQVQTSKKPSPVGFPKTILPAALCNNTSEVLYCRKIYYAWFLLEPDHPSTLSNMKKNVIIPIGKQVNINCSYKEGTENHSYET